jgi:hypothetical protein
MGIAFADFSSPRVVQALGLRAGKLPKLSVPPKASHTNLGIEFLLNRLETFARCTTLIWRRKHWNTAFKGDNG